MDIGDELLDLEEKGWQALAAGRGAEFYDAFLTDDAVMALPVGVIERDAVIEGLRQGTPWAEYEMSDARVLILDEDNAIVVYVVRAVRPGEPPYTAAMSTTYVRVDDEWLIAFHQQTPLNA
jgi:hypothetical protein